MTEDDFYNVANEKTIRQEVATLMTTDEHLSNLEGDAFYEVEDAICNLIKNNQYKIANFVEHQDAFNQIEIFFDGDFDEVPEDIQETIIDEFITEFTDDNLVDQERAQVICDILDSHTELNKYKTE